MLIRFIPNELLDAIEDEEDDDLDTLPIVAKLAASGTAGDDDIGDDDLGDDEEEAGEDEDEDDIIEEHMEIPAMKPRGKRMSVGVHVPLRAMLRSATRTRPFEPLRRAGDDRQV